MTPLCSSLSIAFLHFGASILVTRMLALAIRMSSILVASLFSHKPGYGYMVDAGWNVEEYVMVGGLRWGCKDDGVRYVFVEEPLE